jgi:hypothetical protein
MDPREDDGTTDQRAATAIARGDWSFAVEHLRIVAASRELTASELQQLGEAAYGAGDLEGALSAWEELHARHVAAGEHVAAAAAAATVAMYLMMDTGLMTPVRAWTARAQRLLEDQPETAVHAWLAMVTTYERFLSGDLEGARPWARRAIEVGARHDVAPAVALGRVATARLRILDGAVDEGLALLDDVAVTVRAGALEPLAAGMVYCELICAMQGLAQYDRAEQWTDAMDRWRRGTAFGGINGRCRVHRAEILRLRGSCEDAEEEALHACAELRPWMRREFGWPLTELGTIRLRRGDLPGAEEAFLAAHEHGWDPHPGLALLRLAQGRSTEAAALIAGALDHPSEVPSKERPPTSALCRAPLLDAQVEITVSLGELATARAAAAELAEIADRFRSQALRASAALARARVALAEADPVTALAQADDAVGAWTDIGAPYEAAVARSVVAAAHELLGNHDHAQLERRAARSTFERICARGSAAELVAPGAQGPERDAGTPVGGRSPEPSTGIFRLDGDTRTVGFAGRTVLLRDLKGMHHLERLLVAPGREFHVLDLVTAEEGAAADLGDAGPVLDARAKEAFRRRLAEVDDDLDDAVRCGDAERAALAEADRDYLVRELAGAFGLGGRSRLAGATSERARASVTRALRYAMERIGEHHPVLADHLERTIRTGTYCCYDPDPRAPVRWLTSTDSPSGPPDPAR